MNKNFNFLTGRKNDLLIQHNELHIHPNALSAFKELQLLAKKEINADLRIISAFRSFERQEVIWNGKVSGEKKITDSDGNTILPSKYSELELIHHIMRFSAIPGASRHHWGTDIDVYDAALLDKSSVELTPKEYGEGGVFSKLNLWLEKKISHQNSFGFYRPYDKELGGISPEAWHLSHAPTSQSFFESYTLDLFIQNLEQSDILLKEVLIQDANALFERYILNISSPL